MLVNMDGDLLVLCDCPCKVYKEPRPLFNIKIHQEICESSVWQPLSIHTARELDSESGLYNYRGRYYSTSLSRFINRDPIGYDIEAANLYCYAGNTPATATDPHGLVIYQLDPNSDGGFSFRPIPSAVTEEICGDDIYLWRVTTRQEDNKYQWKIWFEKLFNRDPYPREPWNPPLVTPNVLR